MNREVHVLLAAILLAANALCLAPTTAIAAVIPLTDASVIGGNHSIEGEWDTGGANGDFAGGNITDGDRSEDSPDSMWLANGENETNEEVYLVIDLGDSYNIGQIDLYNTHNRAFNNYATDSFRIEASNSVVDLGSPDDFDLSGTVSTILTGNMSTTTGEDPVTTVDTFTSFTAHPEGAVQYLKFVSITGMHNIPSEAYHNDLRGLNEIEVFTQPPVLEEATEFTWTTSNIGDWADPNNWSFPSGFSAPVNRANSPTHTAIFGSGISGPTTVSTQAAVSVNRVVFHNTGNSYAISGLGSVNLEFDPDDPLDPSDAFGPPSMSVTGTHEFQVDVNLHDDTTIFVGDPEDPIDGSSTLIFDGPLDLMGNTLTKTGVGTMNINNSQNTGSGTLIITGGLLGGSGEVGGSVINQTGTVGPGDSPGILSIAGDYTQDPNGTLWIEISGTALQPDPQYDQLAVGGTATLDGSLEINVENFTPTDGDTFDVLTAGSGITDIGLELTFTGGAFDPYFSMSIVGGGTILRLTYAIDGDFDGDFDADGDADGADFLLWQRGGSPGGGTQAELSDWLNNYGAPSAVGAAGAVPEPSGLVLLLLGSWTCIATRRCQTHRTG